MSERERYFILGSYHHMLGHASQAALDEHLATIEYEQAATAYEALLGLYPDHFWGANNLASLNSPLRLHSPAEVADRWARLADLRPTHLPLTFRAARFLLEIGDVAAAEPYVERARALASAKGTDPGQVAHASFLKVDAPLGRKRRRAGAGGVERGGRKWPATDTRGPRWLAV